MENFDKEKKEKKKFASQGEQTARWVRQKGKKKRAKGGFGHRLRWRINNRAYVYSDSVYTWQRRVIERRENGRVDWESSWNRIVIARLGLAWKFTSARVGQCGSRFRAASTEILFRSYFDKLTIYVLLIDHLKRHSVVYFVLKHTSQRETQFFFVVFFPVIWQRTTRLKKIDISLLRGNKIKLYVSILSFI